MTQDKAATNPRSASDVTRGHALVKPVAILMVAQMLDKLFYLGREMLVTARFGLGGLTDAFGVGLYTSNFILALLRPLIEDTFIPVYVEKLARDREQAQGILETVALLVLAVTGVLVLGVLVFAPQVVAFVAPGFPSETAALATQVVRVMSVFTLILALTNLTLSVLTAQRAFLLVGLAPLSATAAVVAMIWFFSGALGIHSLTWGLVAGTLVQLAILMAGLRRRRLLRLHIAPRFREVFSALGTFTLLMFLVRLVNMAVDWVDRSLGSRLVEGSIASLGFAMNVYQLPFQVCVLAVTTVAIAQFSWHVARNDMSELKRDFSLAMRVAAFFLVPSTAALIVLHRPIVQVLYERGMFEAQDTAMTASVLLCYALGLVPQSITFITVRLFLARKEAHLILLTVVAGGIVHVLFDLAAVGPLKQAGIALAMSVNATVMAVVSLWLARRKLGPLGGRMILISFIKIGLAALGMGLGLYTIMMLASAWPVVWQVGVCVIAGLLVYSLLAYLLKLAELQSLIAALSRRFG